MGFARALLNGSETMFTFVRNRILVKILLVQPDAKEKPDALNAFFKASKISFKKNELYYNLEYVAKIKCGEKAIATGKTRIISLDDR